MSGTHEIDRSGWDAGPWDGEPDRVDWTTAAGLPGLILRTPLGFLCGYAAVPAEHPWHGAECDDDVTVHGGHWPSAGFLHDDVAGPLDVGVWWLGFDCAHWGDFSPGLAAVGARLSRAPSVPVSTYGTYRDVAYVTAEVESLARQIVEAK